MDEFKYDVEKTDHYYFTNALVKGKSIQNGIPTPETPIPVQVVTSANFITPNNFIELNGGAGISDDGWLVDQTPGGDSRPWSYASSNWVIYLEQGTYKLSWEVSTASTNASQGLRVYTFEGSNFWQSNNSVFTASGSHTLTIETAGIYGIVVKVYDGIVRMKLESDSLNVPYGDIAISIDNELTAIDMQGNFLASLPDGTYDELIVDESGRVFVNKSIGFTMQAETDEITGVVGSTILSSTGEIADGAGVFYKLDNAQTIDLGSIDVSELQDIREERPISLIAILNPDFNYSYQYKPTYEVKNTYKDYNAPEYAYPPNHMGMEWETFDANEWDANNIFNYTGQYESHAVYTVELCELMNSGAFDWNREELNWKDAAYNDEQYNRFCSYFEQRFMFREISMLPPLQWFNALKRMLVYELMPKYKPLYSQIDAGYSPLGENEYYKERHITSMYPETLLSGNSDYISSGEDREFERIKVNNISESMDDYKARYRSIDASMGDELETLFISMYTSYVNAL